MTITPGENIGPYRIIEQLGSGGMATVFKAYHAALDRYVAIKILHPAFKADPQFFERFKREARIVANLEHPNIIPVYDFNEHHGEPYLVMRFVEGDTLKPHMAGNVMPPDQILELMRPICQALSYAHQRGVLHRDIKPSNIMVTKGGLVFLTDFGLARMVQAGESTLSQDMMLGTPQYISPEQAQGIGNLDGRSDIYSLGVVLYEMVTGRVPFSADTPFATVHDHIYAPLPLPSAINPDIDPAVERMLLKALAKDPDDRFATVADLYNALKSTLGAQFTSVSLAETSKTKLSSPVSQTMVDQQKRGIPWWIWAGGAAMTVCVLAGLLAGMLSLGRADSAALPITDGQPASNQVANSEQPMLNSQPGDIPIDNLADQPAIPASDGQSDSGPDTPNQHDGAELTRQAEQALQLQQFEEAANLYMQAIEADPHSLPAYFGLSETLHQVGDEANSLAVLEEAVLNNPRNPIAALKLGEAFMLNHNPEAAMEAFEHATQVAPDMPIPYAGLALALLEQDRDDEAKEALDTALALDRLSPLVRLANAIYQYKLGNEQEARLVLQRLARDTSGSDFVKERAQVILDHLGE